MKPRQRRVKSLNFYQEDEALLDWCLRRPEPFSNFVIAILYSAMAQDGHPPARAAPTLNEIEEVVTAVIRRELRGQQFTLAGVEADAEEVDEELERSLMELF